MTTQLKIADWASPGDFVTFEIDPITFEMYPENIGPYMGIIAHEAGAGDSLVNIDPVGIRKLYEWIGAAIAEHQNPIKESPRE